MKKQSYILLILLSILMISVGSCTIKKRSYQPGYYVDWHNFNRKSKSNSENTPLKIHETINEENIVLENSVDKIEEQHLEINQEINPVFSSIDETENNVEMVRASEHINSIDYKTKEEVSEVLTPARNEKVYELSEEREPELPVHDLAIVGFVLSVLSVIFFMGSAFSDSVMLAVFILMFPSFIFAMLGVLISIVAIIIIFLNQDKYRGLWLAIAGLVIPLLNFIVLVFL